MPNTNAVTRIGLIAALVVMVGTLLVLLEKHAGSDEYGGQGPIARDRRLMSTYENARTDPAARSALLDPGKVDENDAFLQHFYVYACTGQDAVLSTGRIQHPSPLADRTIDPDLDAALCRFAKLNLRPRDLLRGLHE